MKIEYVPAWLTINDIKDHRKVIIRCLDDLFLDRQESMGKDRPVGELMAITGEIASVERALVDLMRWEEQLSGAVTVTPAVPVGGTLVATGVTLTHLRYACRGMTLFDVNGHDRNVVVSMSPSNWDVICRFIEGK
jgi:hypothetical protein